MNKRNPKIFLEDILESIERIEEYTRNFSKGKFADNLQIQDAVARRIGIIGEAVKNLPISFRNKYSNIPWKKMAGTRDVIIHDYSGIDIDLVWEIVKAEAPF